ncbi:MAG: PIG-L family deacetylase [Ferruginibacter sp.]
MKKLFLTVLASLQLLFCFAQNPEIANSADILLQMKKLNVLGSVLYIAAHPDDENNALLPYLANETLYRTAYLSLTRGDGGQNLIGDEQGIDLGLIRTQELLAARRVDGAEQYFTRAYEFGFSKSAEEALRIWDKEKILSDVVWVIRKYQPDVIIKRFPPDKRAGHGHHAASSVLADEAFTAAADANRFPEQFKYGVKPWQAKRILWNTYNFGSNNTTAEDQLKIDIGGYNPLMGKSYGELGGEARTMHKSQGEGRPRRRGESYEYFTTLAGDAAKKTLMDGVDINWDRLPNGAAIQSMITEVINTYKPEQPELSVSSLIKIYDVIKGLPEGVWRNKKLADVKELIEECSALFMEVTSKNQLNVMGDTAQFTITAINRTGIPITEMNVQLFGKTFSLTDFKQNINNSKSVSVYITRKELATQPYWLQRTIKDGIYDVENQEDIGKPENDPYTAVFSFKVGADSFNYSKQIVYKYTDPVRGELNEPTQIVYPLFINSSPSIMIFKNGSKNEKKLLHFSVQSNLNVHDKLRFNAVFGNKLVPVFDSVINYQKGSTQNINVVINSDSLQNNSTVNVGADISAYSFYEDQYFSLRKISYPHIPDLFYNYYDESKLIKMDLKTVGKKIGYIAGAGDKVTIGLEAMGYDVALLNESDINDTRLAQFDAIITGIRAYNLYEYLTDKNEVLNRYVKNGGNLIIQYMKSNFVGQKKITAGPYPFSIDGGTRVTEEDAKVNFLLPASVVLNYPNKITEKDFDGWIQERSTYQAVKLDEHFVTPLGMHDRDDKETNGSLAIAKYGKGNVVYASLVFFRELPAGVPGAYRLMANLIALPKNK